MKDFMTAALAAVLLTGCAGQTTQADGPAAASADGPISAEAIARHVQILASDEYEGRAPGTPGEEKTVRYIAEQFQAVGLKPGNNGSWYQDVPLVEMRHRADQLRIVAKGQAAALPDDGAVLVARRLQERIQFEPADVVFVGHGISAPELNWDDYAGVDVAGKVVLFVPGLPKGKDSPLKGQASEHLATRSAKVETAGKHGAIAAIALSDDEAASERWAGLVGTLTEARRRLPDDPTPSGVLVEGALSRGDTTALLAAARQTQAALRDAAARPGFKAMALGVKIDAQVDTDVRRFVSHNVVGMLPGRERPDEQVLVMAHWDHLGHCPADKNGDTLCNGAVDNASGVGGLIEAARAAVRMGPAERSLLFLATTAEEGGLLGAEHYARAPVYPLSKLVGGVNFDTIAVRGAGTDVTLLGKGLSDFDAYFSRAAKAQGRSIVADDKVQSFFQRSDHYPLAAAGVPVLIATGLFDESEKGGGAARTQAYFSERYHRPADQPSFAIDFTGAAQDVELGYSVARALADSGDWPRWKPDTPYAKAREASRR